jgi:hypothetical protein
MTHAIADFFAPRDAAERLADEELRLMHLMERYALGSADAVLVQTSVMHRVYEHAYRLVAGIAVLAPIPVPEYCSHLSSKVLS